MVNDGYWMDFQLVMGVPEKYGWFIRGIAIYKG